MRIIYNNSTDPAFNLAAEEYLLEHSHGDVFMLWRNAPAVIIGKNQNAWAEVNTDVAEERGIPVVRRLTGGGAVFHDPGNVNFTFITDAAGNGIDFEPFISPVIAALAELGINAERDGRNDIIADGCKISGNAQCRRRCADGRQKVMHHGTLLYDADLATLAGVLRASPEKLRSKGIRSVSSRVTNIKSIGGLTETSEEFANCLVRIAEREYAATVTHLTDEEIRGTELLAQTKYRTWEWNYGRSPEHEESRTKRFPWGTVTMGYTVKSGVIAEAFLTGDFFGAEPADICIALIGCRFDRNAVRAVLENVPVGEIIHGGTAEDIAETLFDTDLNTV